MYRMDVVLDGCCIERIQDMEDAGEDGSLDKLYTQMGKVNRLRNRVEPFIALIWALGNVLKPTPYTLHAGPASPQRRTQSMSLYGHSWFKSQRRRAGHPPFPI